MKNTGKKRPLTAGEISMAAAIFGDQLDYKKIRVINRKFGIFSFKNGGRTFLNTVNISGTAYCDDYSRQAPHLKAFFIHELTHIWQYQTRPLWLASNAIEEGLRYNFNYKTAAYTYKLDLRKKFTDYGYEQQASIIEDFFRLCWHGLRSHNGRCQNANLGVRDRLKYYRKILSPHFPPVAYSPIPGPKPVNPF